VKDFYSFTRDGLRDFLKSECSVPSFTADQVFEWVYKHGLTDFSLMSNISKANRELFATIFSFEPAKQVSRQISVDGTRKYLFEVSKGMKVESVMIKQPGRMTLCISSQYGCAMGCTFCQTAQMGFQGNLSAGDIIRQVLAVKEDAKLFSDDFQNIVFMGMGEPLHNFEGVTGAMKILLDPNGFGIGPRKITVSSVGLVPAIERFGQLDLGINLAVSLNATTDEVRSKIMPVNRKYPLEKLISCLKGFPLPKRKKITIEYVMLAGVNDSRADLERLPILLKGLGVKINLIPYNENAGLGFKTPSRTKVMDWNKQLNDLGLASTIRWSKGVDIDAACGQLNSQIKKANESEALSQIS
jgi:23S rRNA (adenine2503-C2)-methyltransferase